MKFKIKSKEFASVLANQSKVINSKNTLSILDNFKMTLYNDGEGAYLSVLSSDQEITSEIVIRLEGDVECGSLCINAQKLTDIVRKFGDKEIEFESHEDSNEVVITCGKGKYTLPKGNVMEYPQKEMPNEGFFTMPTTTLIEGLNSTRNAISTDTIRPILCGVYMNILEDRIDFVGTDTHQLVVCRTQNEGLEQQSVIIPSKTIGLVLTSFAKYPNVDIRIDDKGITFKAEDMILTSRVQRGRYPDYNRVIPQEPANKVKVNRKELLDVINRVSGFASSSTNLLCLEEGGMMEVKVSARDYDNTQTAEDYVMCEGLMNGIKIGLNSEYLTNVLKIFEEDEITLQISNPAQPIKIEEGNLLAILMPMALNA